MSLEVRVPALPESVADARVLTWSKRPGEAVREGENLVELETDKVVLEVPAPRTGVLSEILAAEGAMVHTDDVLALISEGAVSVAPAPKPASTPSTAPTATPTPPAAATQPNAPPHVTPSARQLVKELHLEPSQIPSRDGRIQKADVLAYLDAREHQAPERHPDLAAAPAAQTPVEPALAPTPALSGEAGRPEQRVPMTRLRARIAERLLQAQQNAALLTTFNEVNLSAVNALRARYKETFEQRHGVRLGLMSFFVKAAVEALQRFPVLNASIDGEDILYHGYYDIGIAVSSPRGLVVPILRNADQLGMAEVEQGIADFGQKARDGSLSYEELTGGTFSITNGGVFGSLLSTPILNPPQSAILGLHKIQERPIVENGQIVVAPMMYLALTYDHRLIDGRDAVQFLVAIKELLEDPARLLLRV
ncbi:2-oxoglutarate dehydrogenase complex dihydrolipoyllysine-residue succinyltransferase [Allochromatium vinosum]|uniref:Dihydrolipoyllysine-residue succinyltransferase component of 2-oxoglutarate dehydrogenase complex n=1 Tax=Allochromatium vinosum (strain ATCC 17899 / DSM 180 / NBRC 103801 / NCIMB 10441 / D) TaxID=572477 RepID=D3RMJ7_ALLVD|nr:2-oxoglutarate dehydrogenase complex dihydrolipoyllysine-residue succinyltransferase [Allochromatium vinosum]ADC61255.1 2-oxoglutarate dehydrogenase, E2 subunit, dihydrolipoamide succinyltransferase [Allochromatium vinosum DSM 180]